MLYPIIYRVSTIQGGAGFLPSTVSHTMCPLGPGTEAASFDVGMDPEGHFPAARGWELGEFWKLNNNDVTQTSVFSMMIGLNGALFVTVCGPK